MSRSQIFQTVTAIWLTGFVFNTVYAQSPQFGPSAAPAYEQPVVQFTGGIQPALLPANAPHPATMVSNQQMAPVAQSMQPAPGQMIHDYPHTGAALYPSPIPNVPYQVGGTMHTNQAFYPHEMLYAHRYKAMYPPFYYVVKGGWFVTPWGVRSNDVWKLTGTTVDVKYKTRYGILSGFSGYKR